MAPLKELVLERSYEAPLASVWQAFTEAKQISQWWGPDNVTIPECELDLRVAGRIFIVMEAGAAMGPYHGTRWPMEGVFTVVDSNARLSYTATAWTEGQEATTAIEQETHIQFSAEHGSTTVKIRAAILRSGPDVQQAVSGMEYGFKQELEKLASFLLEN